MVNFRKIGLGLILLAGLATIGDGIWGYEVKRDYKKRFEASLERQISERIDDQIRLRREIREVIKEQERVLGIKHFGEPEISFDKSFLPLKNNKGSEKRSPHATYSSTNNTIIIDLEKYKKSMIPHELGHFYIDRFSENLGSGDWPSSKKFFFESLFRNDKGVRMISEGVATYFGKKTMGDSFTMEIDYGNFKKYFKYLESKDSNNVFYEASYALAAPILDRSLLLTGSVDRGIEILIKNVPKGRDLRDLVVYRDRILVKLEDKNRK